MTPTYIYHSCFLLTGNNSAIIFDYYKDSPDGKIARFLKEWKGNIYVLSSHFHRDHFNPEVLGWKNEREDIVYIFSKDILKRKRAAEGDAVYLRKGDEYRDDNIYVRAFGSTDVGVSFYLECEGCRIFHAGDLNNWHWSDESTPEEIRKAEGDYLHELKEIASAVPQLDIAMFPVDPRIGTDFARGARQFLEKIKVEHFFPMHFWEREEEVRMALETNKTNI